VHNLNENVIAAFSSPLHFTFTLSSFSSVCIFISSECHACVCVSVFVVNECVTVCERAGSGRKAEEKPEKCTAVAYN